MQRSDEMNFVHFGKRFHHLLLINFSGASWESATWSATWKFYFYRRCHAAHIDKALALSCFIMKCTIWLSEWLGWGRALALSHSTGGKFSSKEFFWMYVGGNSFCDISLGFLCCLKYFFLIRQNIIHWNNKKEIFFSRFE